MQVMPKRINQLKLLKLFKLFKKEPQHLPCALLLASTPLLLLTASPQLLAADWKFTPRLSISGNYTDNVDLSPDNEESSFITQVTPGFSLSKNGSHLQTNINYGLQWAESWGGAGNDFSNHQLSATATAELIDDHLFIDANSSISQQLISNRSASTGSNINNNEDFATTTTFSISPYWQQRIGDNLTSTTRLTYDEVLFDDVDQDSGGFSFTNSIAFTEGFGSTPGQFHWSLDVDASRVTADASSSTMSGAISVSAGYRVSAKLDTTLTYGYVDNDIDNPTDSSAAANDFWGAQIDLSPSSRTQMRASYNSSLTSNGHGLVFNHRSRHTNYSLVYTENISSTRQELLTLTPVGSLICPTSASFSIADCRFVDSASTPQPGPDEQVVNFLAPVPSLVDDRFIQKSLTANISYSKGKSTYNLGAYSRERTYQTGTLPMEQDNGFNLGWTLRLNSRTNAGLTYSWSQLEPENEAKDTLNRLGLRLSRRLDPDTSVSVSVSANERTSDDPTLEYAENSFSLNLSRSF